MNELTMSETFMRFGGNFQENLCQLMFEDRPFFDQITEVLDVSFFERKYLQVFAKALIDYRDKYNTHPNVEVMITVLRTELNHHDKAVSSKVRTFFDKVHKSDGVEESDFIKDKAIDFCRK